MKSSIVFLIATIVHIMCTFVSFIFSGSFDDIGQEHTLYDFGLVLGFILLLKVMMPLNGLLLSVILSFGAR